MNPAHAQELAKQGLVPVYRIPNQPIDYVTEYDICRIVRDKEVHSIGRFSFSEAQAAESSRKILIKSMLEYLLVIELLLMLLVILQVTFYLEFMKQVNLKLLLAQSLTMQILLILKLKK